MPLGSGSLCAQTIRRLFVGMLSMLLGVANPSIAQEAKLSPSYVAGESSFGSSLTIDGEYIIVGAPYDDEVDSLAGAAYVFNRQGLQWIEQAKLIPSDAIIEHTFGTAVALDDDYALIGAQNSADGTFKGSAYIFKRTGTQWNEQTILLGSDVFSNDLFGRSVDIDGDYAVVGTTRGASAYVFMRNGAKWEEKTKLTTTNDPFLFGESVAISTPHIVVGSYKEDSFLNEGVSYSVGAVHIFALESSSWSHQEKLTPPLPDEASTRFGHRIAIDGERVAVLATRGSALYIFRRMDSMWVQEARIETSTSSLTPLNLWEVAMSAELVAVSGWFSNTEGTRFGAVLLYEYADDQWIEQTILTSPEPCDFDVFGVGLDLDEQHLVVGAPCRSSSGSHSDAVYIYSRTALALTSSEDQDLFRTEEYELQVYPNPSAGIVEGELTVTSTQHVTIELFNILGHRVRLLHYGQLLGGHTHRFQMHGGDLGSGQYIIRVQGERFGANKAITVLH